VVIFLKKGILINNSRKRMNVTQRIVFSMMMVLLIGILVLQHKLADNFSVMGIVLFIVISSLVVFSLFAPRPTRAHKIIGWWSSLLLTHLA
jgi:Na+/proline symporter